MRCYSSNRLDCISMHLCSGCWWYR